MSVANYPVARWLAAINIDSQALAPRAAVIVAGTLVLTASAKVQVPFWPVPMTMQTCLVLLMGYALGFRMAMATLVAYLIEGAVGLPVFAGTPEKGIGLAYMAGPTGGYLAGFLLAAALTSQLHRVQSKVMLPVMIVGMLAGAALIQATGFAWLSVLMGTAKAWQFGVLPFVAGDVLKALLAAFAAQAAARSLAKS